MIERSGFEPWGPFLESPGDFSGLESRSKILNPTITELFYSHIFNMDRVVFIQEVSGVYTSPFLHIDELKMALRARKVSGAFEKQDPDRGRCVVFLGKTLNFTVLPSSQVYKWIPANLMLGVTLRWTSIPSRGE